MSRVAVIDLGTNTCNLLIAETSPLPARIVHQGKEVVKMGRGGIGKNLLLPDGIERAVTALLKHRETIHLFQVEKVYALATSAVREASNREDFCKQIEIETGFKLDVISGEREAALIFGGVMLAFNNNPGKALILDIGGGSNEFILCDGPRVIWKESFPLGVARIIDRFPLSDPITMAESEAIRSYFDKGLSRLWSVLAEYPVNCLIGCSGAFDTVVDMIDETVPGTKQRPQQEIYLSDFERVYKQLLASTIEERTQMKGLESLRVEMIVPAVILIELVREKAGIYRIYQTDYALREGVLHELAEFD